MHLISLLVTRPADVGRDASDGHVADVVVGTER